MKEITAKTKDECIQWIQKWFASNGNGCKAVIGLSGGKDALTCAALAAKALGPENVIGVAMPEDGQGLNDADKMAEFLGIKFIVAPIGDTVKTLEKYATTPQSRMNIAPRIRMTMLYAISQSNNGRVINTSNASEKYIGYCTRWGDNCGDVAFLGNLTCGQVVELGLSLGLPKEWVEKAPDDGLAGSKPDDDKFKEWGFSYALLDEYIKTGFSGNQVADNAIARQHILNAFKSKPIPTFGD